MLAKKIIVTASAELLAVLESSFFRREGFSFFPVRSSDMVYRLVEAEAPAMAILDLDILGGDGLACCRCIKRDPLLGTTPLVMVLPREGGEALAVHCRQAGCDALVARPLEPEQFLDTACELLGICQRLAPRWPVDIRAVYAAGTGKHQQGRVVNLHGDGMFVAAAKLFPVGTRLFVQLTLPGADHPLGCQGRVAWVNHPEWLKRPDMPSGMGVQLVDAAPEVRSALSAYVAACGQGVN